MGERSIVCYHAEHCNSFDSVDRGTCMEIEKSLRYAPDGRTSETYRTYWFSPGNSDMRADAPYITVQRRSVCSVTI